MQISLGLALFTSATALELSTPWTRRAVCALPGLALTGQLARPANAEDSEAALGESIAELQEKLARLKAAAAAAGNAETAPVPAGSDAPELEATAAPAEPVAPAPPSGPTAFDFDVLFRGEPRDIKPFLGKKASVFVNVKFDDPISIDQMPALQGLVDKYSGDGLNVLAFPTEQGWFEADDGDTLRLKFKQTFDFGKYPTAVVFDKADLLGTKALPLYSWITKAIPNPWGLDRIVFNYEKILVSADGRPLRRYPRKYAATFMEADVQAALRGEPLPPPSQRYIDAWEAAKREAIKSEYAFKYGLNYYKYGSPAS